MADSTVIDVPRFYFQSHKSGSDFAAENDFAPGQPLSRATNQIDTDVSGHELSNHLLLRHRFAIPRRTLSLDIGTNHTLKDASKAMSSSTDYGTSGSAIDTLDQHSDFRTTSGSLNARLVYTEPVGRKSGFQATLTPGVIESQSTRHGWRPDSAGAFTVPDGPMTNTFRSVSALQNVGLGFVTRGKGLRLTVNLALQRTTLRSERISPAPQT